MPNRRWAALGIAAAASTCVTLVGCSGGSASSPGSSPAGPVSRTSAQPAGGPTPRSAGRTSAVGADGRSTQPTADALHKAADLTGNFCADYKNIGKKIPVPSAQGSLSTLRQRSARYLRWAAAYYDGLASEASPQAGTELHVISSANLALANLISSGKVRARSQVEFKMLTLTTHGVAAAASGRLVIYVATRCG
jgi:hypothetical protein